MLILRKERVVTGNLALEGAIGDPGVLLQHGNRLAEDFVERHGGSSTYGAASRCASTAAYHTRRDGDGDSMYLRRGLESIRARQ